MDFQLLVTTLGPIGAALVMIWVMKDKASQAFVERVSKRLEGVENRLDTCEKDRITLHEKMFTLMKERTYDLEASESTNRLKRSN